MLRRDFIKLTAALGAASALPLWSRAAWAADRPAFAGTAAVDAGRAGKIALALQAGETRWLPGAATKTWGFNGALLRAGGEAAAWPAGDGRYQKQPGGRPVPSTGMGWKFPATSMAARRR